MEVRFEVEGGFLPDEADTKRLAAAAQRELDMRSRVTVENAVGEQLAVQNGTVLQDHRGTAYRASHVANIPIGDPDKGGYRIQKLTLERLHRKPTKAQKKAAKRQLQKARQLLTRRAGAGSARHA